MEKRTQMMIHDDAMQKRAQVLQWNIVNGMSQREIAQRLGVTTVRVQQIVRNGYREVIKGTIKLPSDFDISTCKTLVKNMLLYSIYKMYSNRYEADQHLQVLSQLTISEQLEWIRKSKQIRWYQ